MKKILLLAALLLSPALAQTAPAAPGGAAQGGPTAAQRAQFQKFQSIFDLQQSVGLIADVDKEKGLAFTKDQAGKLLPVLKDLGSRADLKPANATKILDNLENKIYTPEQLQKMDDLQLARQEERRKQAAARGNTGAGAGGFRLPGIPGGGVGGGQRPAGAGQGGARGGGFADLLTGKPFNPFKQERGQKMIVDTVALLSKK